MNAALATLDSLSDQIAALDVCAGYFVALALPPRQPELPRDRLAGHSQCRIPATRGSGCSTSARRTRPASPPTHYLPARGGRGGEDRPHPSPSARLDASPGVGASSGVVLLFDTAVGATLLTTAWALGLVPALPRPSPPRRRRGRESLSSSPPWSSRRLRDFGRTFGRAQRSWRDLASTCAGSSPIKPERGPAGSASPSPCWPRSACRPRSRSPGWSSFATGMSTLVPATPGGARTQQLLVVVALQQVASRPRPSRSRSGCRSASPLVNTIVGLVAIMLVFGTMRPATIKARLRAR